MKTLYYFIIPLIILSSCNQKSATSISMHTNDLIKETSPYLLQHAHNPVNWKAWNDESLALAEAENKLVIVSIGYSACHWCHVMEKESFENDSVAKLMNSEFVNIKVDREERPDIDQVYMTAIQLMTGSGGWPLNCITLPDGRPVFGGTYFTKDEWLKVLKELSELYKTNPEKVIAYAEKLTEGVKNSELISVNREEPNFTSIALDTTIKSFKKQLDYKNGGTMGAPKFPMPSSLHFLLRQSIQNKDEDLKSYVNKTLTKLASGGIYDQIGGGFSRYSVDEKWHIPHFEKMLYDNAQLVSLYSDAYLVSKNETYKTIVEETLKFIERELTHTNGAFYSSLDADSKNEEDELEEGIFYCWTKDELKTLLNEDFNLFKDYYNINSFGKWENNQYVLIKNKSDVEFMALHNLTEDLLHSKILEWKNILIEERAKREPPRTDDKTLTSWNALMLQAYIDAYRVFGNKNYLEKALKNATFIKQKQLRSDGGLYHNFKNNKSTIEGFSEDYAAVIKTYISLYEVTLDENWLAIANDLMTYTITHFLDKESGMFYFTSDVNKNLITRKFEIIDNVIPSSNSMLANSLFKLSHYYYNTSYEKMARQMLNNVKYDLETSPSGYSNWLNLYLNYASPYYEIAISGNNALEKLKELNTYYLPNILIAGASKQSDLPLLENRYNSDNTYIYVCVNGSCKLPRIDVEKAVKEL
ncbi:thioredoxin domain-containing protein [Aquimarina sp. BL5]|uniref:thioredoxin domain-containing protein n=1 Tax=Aquimarina sp. BL5 TaxID=1714860 RepID=UPI0026D539ED